jgi:extracellular factor (EF) 3-hydroxypalmitic acid methyl ester biosynthesis protein
MRTTNHQLLQPIEFLQQLIHNGGPDASEYDKLNRVVNLLSEEYKSGSLSPVDMQILQDGFGQECLEKTLHGHSITKPYGYAGDFMIIDKIYREHVTDDARFEKWDILWHNLAATKAVRNRKAYFIKTMINKLAAGKPLQVLNLASGPARDLADLYAIIQPEQLSTVCVEADERAISYARKLNKAHANQIQFIQKNIFRYETTEQFDIVWSAGLFDYFNDPIFVKLLRRFVSRVKPGGEMIIGNFSTDNPSRNMMEFFGDWYLHHRSEEELLHLALQAGIDKKNIHIGKEAEGVNLFLHIKA